MSDDYKDANEKKPAKKAPNDPSSSAATGKTTAETSAAKTTETLPQSSDNKALPDEDSAAPIASPSQVNEPSTKEKLTAAQPQPDSEPSSNTADLFNAQPAPRLPTGSSGSRRSWWPVIAILLAILTLLAVAWAGYQQHLMQQSWQQMQSSLNEQLKQQAANNQSSNSAAQSGLQIANENQRLLNQQNQLVQQLRQTQTATQERIRELSGRRNQDWMLAEAEYLIRLAEFKVTLEKDKSAAIALLKTADEKILAMGDSRLLELRQAIAKDIADLQLVVEPDIAGQAARLDALVHQIPQLNILALEFEPLQKASEKPLQEETEGEFSWQRLYQNFLNDFVTIKEHDEARKPLMTPEQRGNLNANIQLALQQAQIAMLRDDLALYQNNIDNALNWINEFFKRDETANRVIEQLTELRQQRVSMDLPKQLTAKQEIESLNQQRLYQWLQSTSQAVEDKNAMEPQP